MTNFCVECNSTDIIKKGTAPRFGKLYQRFKCHQCGSTFYTEVEAVTTTPAVVSKTPEQELMDILKPMDYVRDEAWVDGVLKHDRFVITSAQSDTPIDEQFFETLKGYCQFHKAALLVIPVRYRNPTNPTEIDLEVLDYDERLEDYLFENPIRLHPKLKVLGSLKIAATAEHPLTGLAPLSKGDSLIIGHNQLQMTTLPVQPNDHPVVMTTTGSLSEKNYSISKQGHKAEFNHSQSAIVVEIDGDQFHLRHLNFDGEGFYDIQNYYCGKKVVKCANHVKAIVTGDEHVTFFSKEVFDATYGPQGMVSQLKPDYIIRHDVLDCYSISHHHRKNVFTKFKKHVTGKNNIVKELDETIHFIRDTTPHGSTTVIVSSNHNDHLTKWLNECDIRTEPQNALMYHYLMYRMLEEIEGNPDVQPNPFELLAVPAFKEQGTKVIFTSRLETFKVFDIEIAIHGDRGANGAKGSRDTFAKLPSKTIVGHSHSPGIEKGCYQVGTSSNLTLEYNDGPSSWMNTHCLVYANGKRQLINIINGKWRK